MTQLAIILTQDQLDAKINEAAERAVAKYVEALKPGKDLPEQLTCKRAAEVLGVSEKTFHTKYAILKRFDGSRVFVNSSDCLKFKK